MYCHTQLDKTKPDGIPETPLRPRVRRALDHYDLSFEIITFVAAA